jgi:hypothetical protein
MKILKTIVLLVVAVAAVLIAIALYQNKAAREKIKSETKETVSDVVNVSTSTADKLATNAVNIATNVAAKVETVTSNAVDKAATVTTNVIDEAKQKLEGNPH